MKNARIIAVQLWTKIVNGSQCWVGEKYPLIEQAVTVDEVHIIKVCDFILIVFLQNDHVEAPEEQPKKTKLFFIHAVEHWDAEFYVKVNDDIYLNVGK